jgi:hypothetical protein
MAGAERTVPSAVIRPAGRGAWAWAVPALAVLLAGWLAFAAWRQRGHVVTVVLPDGQGLKVGDAARYRGITVGEIRRVGLANDLGRVRVKVSLVAQADHLARTGTRFWVVRPRLRLTEIEGVETLLGPRYLAVEPAPTADGAVRARQREFVGLDEAPVVTSIDPDDLEIVLEARRRGSLRAGAPVTYRQVRVGTVLSVGLASDGGLVEARVHVPKAYRQLIRANTRFWDAGGVQANLGLSGLSVEVESIAELLSGGVALATPPLDEAGAAARNGRRYPIEEEPKESWLEWEPTIAIGSSLLPPGAVMPQPQRATIAWKEGLIFKGSRSRRGWVIQTEDGVLGPADLLGPPPGKAEEETVSLEVAGQVVPITDDPPWQDAGLARRDGSISSVAWPAERMRVPEIPEDCIAVGDPNARPIPLAASRLSRSASGWAVDPAVSVDDAWHGACVVSRADGALVGLLLVDDDEVRVAFVP